MELNQVIARKLFRTLVLDYEWNFNGETSVYCRILNDGNYYGQLTARNREEAINKFMKGQYVHYYQED